MRKITGHADSALSEHLLDSANFVYIVTPLGVSWLYKLIDFFFFFERDNFNWSSTIIYRNRPTEIYFLYLKLKIFIQLSNIQ